MVVDENGDVLSDSGGTETPSNKVRPHSIFDVQDGPLSEKQLEAMLKQIQGRMHFGQEFAEHFQQHIENVDAAERAWRDVENYVYDGPDDELPPFEKYIRDEDPKSRGEIAAEFKRYVSDTREVQRYLLSGYDDKDGSLENYLNSNAHLELVAERYGLPQDLLYETPPDVESVSHMIAFLLKPDCYSGEINSSNTELWNKVNSLIHVELAEELDYPPSIQSLDFVESFFQMSNGEIDASEYDPLSKDLDTSGVPDDISDHSLDVSTTDTDGTLNLEGTAFAPSKYDKPVGVSPDDIESGTDISVDNEPPTLKNSKFIKLADLQDLCDQHVNTHAWNNDSELDYFSKLARRVVGEGVIKSVHTHAVDIGSDDIGNGGRGA